MDINPNLKIFLVEFGKPDLSSYVSWSNNLPPVFVIALNYNEAASKALDYVEDNTQSKSILGSDGSLNLDSTSEEVKVKSVKVVSDEIIW